jgi:hypothetical protein
MQAGIVHWSGASRAPRCCAPQGGGFGHRFAPRGGGDDGGGGFDDGGAGFGVRRPLRFLAYKLDLDEKQVAEFARIINDLKTERAQAEVDRRRAVAALADAIEAESFAQEQATHAGSIKTQSAERLQAAVARALQQMHALLDAGQRSRLAYLIRSGALAI